MGRGDLQVIPGFREIRVDSEGFPEVGYGLIYSPRSRQDDAHVVMGPKVVGPDSEGFGKKGKGFFEIAFLRILDCQPVVGFGIAGAGRGAVEGGEFLAFLCHLGKGDGEVLPGDFIGRVLPQGLGEIIDGFFQLSLFCEDDTDVVVGVGFVRLYPNGFLEVV